MTELKDILETEFAFCVQSECTYIERLETPAWKSYIIDNNKK